MIININVPLVFALLTAAAKAYLAIILLCFRFLSSWGNLFELNYLLSREYKKITAGKLLSIWENVSKICFSKSKCH